MSIGIGELVQQRYRVTAQLGEGGSAQVFLAEDLLFDEPVALKWLSDEALGPVLRSELERLRGLYHPHLVRVRDHGRHRGRAFYTADLIRGQPLVRFAEHAREPAVLEALADALSALDFLHRLGLRHGDFKPDNVLVDERGRGVLIDLGCAHPLGRRSEHPSGTSGYMAPEVLHGRAADARADLFAVGVTLAELGAGEPGLVRRLRSERAAGRPADVAEVLAAMGASRDLLATALGPAPALLGRDAQLRTLRAFIDGVAAGQDGARALRCLGPAGSGRSRMLSEGSWEASAQLRVVQGRASRGVAELLARASGQPRAGLDACLSAQAQLAAADGTLLVLDDVQELAGSERRLLDTLLRALPGDGRVGWLLAERTAGDAPAQAGDLLLPPLSARDVQRWAAAVLSPAGCQDLHRHTHGLPGAIARALGALARGGLRVGDLAGVAAAAPGGVRLAPGAVRQFRALPPDLQREVGLLAIAEQGAPRLASPRAFAPEHRVLLAQGIARLEGGWLRLARTAEAAAWLECMSPQEVTKLHRAAAAELSADTPEALARRVFHLQQAGLVRESLALCEAHAEALEQAPQAFLPSVRQAHLDAPADARWGVLAVRLAQRVGDARSARSCLLRALRGRPEPALRRQLHRAAVDVFAAEGHPARALRVVQSLALDASQGEEAADLREAEARLRIRLGQFERAERLAQEGLAAAPPPHIRARLLEDAGVAASYGGHAERGLSWLDTAVALHDAGSPRALARCLVYRGIAAYQAGRWERAAEDYARAFELADRHQLEDLVVNSLANLGTVQQQLGRWGQAQDSYQRALRLASSLLRLGSARTLRANLASLYLQVGRFESAERELCVLQGPDAAHLGRLAPAVCIHRGELHHWKGAAGQAQAEFERALSLLSREERGREFVEALLWIVACAVEQGLDGEAARSLAAARDALDTLRASDLEARAEQLEARLALLQGRTEQAVRVLSQAVSSERFSRAPLVLAELRGTLAEAYLATGAPQLCEEERRAARRQWERVAADLPAEQRDAFWQHPLRRLLAGGDSPAPRPAGSAGALDTLRLRHFLEINRGLGAARSVERVLDHAIDAAIELTGAQRGFVLLSRAPRRGFRVAVARNLDRERLARAQGKLSRSIAQRVIERDEPVITVDAGADRRFRTQASVHAMQLKSVLCVPIRSGKGVLGALYLDNSVQAARFAEGDLELLTAFADQVAIALTNTRLNVELRRRTRELEREQARVQQLLEGQAQQIARLQEEVRERQSALETRYDYAQIVGRSAPMRRVLSLLDRVIDTELSVLVAGESGTGKELVARAVHRHSARAERPFVGVNCAALPRTLLESELFGHVRGAFTGAERDREGLFVAAQGGTLFLDELGDMPVPVQASLLRVLQEREVRPLGSTHSLPVDVRLVCATNRDLSECVARGEFREDLYYRVAGVEVRLPSLRERTEDIVPIAEARLSELTSGGEAPRLSAAAIAALLKHPWPGNVRELHNCLARALALAEGDFIEVADLGLVEAPRRAPRATDRRQYEAQEAEQLLSALTAERWNVSRVARQLGIPRNTLYRKLKKYGIRRDALRAGVGR